MIFDFQKFIINQILLEKYEFYINNFHFSLVFEYIIFVIF